MPRPSRAPAHVPAVDGGNLSDEDMEQGLPPVLEPARGGHHPAVATRGRKLRGLVLEKKVSNQQISV